jgi:hypothetical protein
MQLQKSWHISSQDFRRVSLVFKIKSNRAEKGKLGVTYIPIADMVANRITKPLGRVAFERLKEQIGVVDVELTRDMP